MIEDGGGAFSNSDSLQKKVKRLNLPQIVHTFIAQKNNMGNMQCITFKPLCKSNGKVKGA